MRIVRRLPLRGLALLGALLAATLAGCSRPPAEPAHPTTTTATAAPASNANRSGGCRDLFLYAANDDATRVVIVSVDARSVGLENGQRKTFDLASVPKDVHVWLDVYVQPAHIESLHCTKHPKESQQAERYTASEGTLTVERGADGTVNATIDGAKFALEGRPPIAISTLRIDRIRVGWLPG